MFRGYDARGIYGVEVTETKFSALGGALYKLAKSLVVGMDFRKPNSSLFKAFSQGFGGEINFMGNCPTAAVSFNSRDYGMSITASHNPPEYAGAKFIHNRHGFFEKELSGLKKLFEEIEAKPKIPSKKAALVNQRPDLLEDYVEGIPEITAGVFDLGGGAACAVKKVFPKTIFGEPDPLFQKRAPEPREEALGELKKKTTQFRELGFAFDGDADRVMVVAGGKVIPGPTVTALLCSQHFKKGDRIVLNIEFSEESKQFIRDELGMKVIVCPVGTKHVVTNVLEKNAALGAEPNGHYYIPKHVPDSDGIYAAALLSQASPRELLEFSKKFKNTILTDAMKVKAEFRKLGELAREKALEVSTMDGVRAAYDDYSVLMRASQTEPKIRITVEAETKKKAEKGMQLAKKMIKKCVVS